MAPVVAVNRPDDPCPARPPDRLPSFGSVGHPIPGVAAKVVDQDTGDGADRSASEGLLLVQGPEHDARLSATSPNARPR